MATGKARGFAMGLQTFDHFFRIKGGELLIVAGRTAMGKTSFSLQMAHEFAKQIQAAGDTNGKIVFYSAEMTGVQLFQKLASNVSGINLQYGYAGRWTKDDVDEYRRVLGKLSELPIMVNDLNSIRTDHMWDDLNGMASAGYPPRAVFFDYIELAADEGAYGQEHSRISGVAQKLKQIAMNLQIPVVGLSQVNRQTEGEANKIPYLQNLAGSDGVARMADKVLTLMRPGYYLRNGQQAACELSSDTQGTCYVSIQKDRFGRAGSTFRLRLDEETNRYSDFSPPRDPERLVKDLRARKPGDYGAGGTQ